MALETDFAKEFETVKKICLELKEKSKLYELRCLTLETEVDKLKKQNQDFEVKIARIQKVTDDDNIHEMIENKVLECEKRKADSKVLFWKEKVKHLESKMDRANEKHKEDVNVVPFEEDGCPNKKIDPHTPGFVQSTFRTVIDITDEDVNNNAIPLKNFVQLTDLEHVYEEHSDEFEARSPNTRSGRRKRAANVITSDDENSCDDNAPICTVKRQHTLDSDELEENVSRPLTRLRKVESRNKEAKSNNVVEDELENGDESLGGFIVDDSECVSVYDSQSGDGAVEPEDALNEYKEIMDEIRRRKSSNLKWELEADMLADFGKDTRLCMSAVCALYRQQTDDEKETQITIHYNERGFNQPDSNRGSELAVFLMGRDSDGDLDRTVEELNEYDPEGAELCRTLAIKYSKQLFEIYENKEDPRFPPSPYG